MEVIKTDIEGMLIIEPRLFRDTRGYFFESFSEREFKEKVEQNAISEPIGHIMKLVELMKQEDESFQNLHLHKNGRKETYFRGKRCYLYHCQRRISGEIYH